MGMTVREWFRVLRRNAPAVPRYGFYFHETRKFVHAKHLTRLLEEVRRQGADQPDVPPSPPLRPNI